MVGVVAVEIYGLSPPPSSPHLPSPSFPITSHLSSHLHPSRLEELSRPTMRAERPLRVKEQRRREQQRRKKGVVGICSWGHGRGRGREGVNLCAWLRSFTPS